MQALPVSRAVCYTGYMSHEDPTSRQQLEERITYCEQLADRLDHVVTDLQKRVLSLELQNSKLAAELRQQQDLSRVFGAPHEVPPHY